MKKRNDPHYEALAVFLFVLGMIAIFAGGCRARAPQLLEKITAKEVRVDDGDTISFTASSRPAIRLLQVNAPDRGDCYGEKAYQYLKAVIADSGRLELIKDQNLEADRFQRHLVYLDADGRNVNVDMVRRGLAVPYFIAGERGDHAAELDRLAAQAKRDGRGLWGACKPSEIPVQR